MSKGDGGDRGLFSPTILGFLVASVVAIFALSVLLATMSREDTPFDATLASPSAIGHKGFYTLLDRLELPVSKSRVNGRIGVGRHDVLIVEEPDPAHVFDRDSGLREAPTVLLVLPKWSGRPDAFHDGWISNAEPLEPDVPRRVLALVDKAAQVGRGPAPAAWTRNVIGVSPTFDGQVQTISHSSLTPLIGTADAILLGEYATPQRRIWILADPDPLENHGIGLSANAQFALALVNRLRRGNGSIVFDETVHGAVAPERNPIQLLFQFPFVIVTAQIIAALALLILATTARFGGAEDPPPPFAAGKARLIDNMAALMDRAGHQVIILRRYISVRLADAGRALHAPAGLDDAGLARWLDRVGAARGIGLKAVDILNRGAAPPGRAATLIPRLFNEARDMDRWNKDILDKDASHGSGKRQDNR